VAGFVFVGGRPFGREFGIRFPGTVSIQIRIPLPGSRFLFLPLFVITQLSIILLFVVECCLIKFVQLNAEEVTKSSNYALSLAPSTAFCTFKSWKLSLIPVWTGERFGSRSANC